MPNPDAPDSPNPTAPTDANAQPGAEPAPQAAAGPDPSNPYNRARVPIFKPPLPAHNDHAQLHFEGVRDALRSGFTRGHLDTARAQQLEFEQSVVVQCMLQVLMQKGLVKPEELNAALPTVHEEMTKLRSEQYTGPLLAPLVGLPDIDIDCGAHYDTCEAACCTSFHVFLTMEEAQSGKYLWDITVPYKLLSDADECCVYFDRQGRKCTIWQDRPLACRAYDCRSDTRIWSDYPARNLSVTAMEKKAKLAAFRAKG